MREEERDEKKWKGIGRRETTHLYSENHRKGNELERSDFERQEVTDEKGVGGFNKWNFCEEICNWKVFSLQ